MFSAVNLLYDTIMMDTCHFKYVHTTKIKTLRENPNVKLWVLGDNNALI